jgi:hypothetical protein
MNGYITAQEVAKNGDYFLAGSNPLQGKPYFQSYSF